VSYRTAALSGLLANVRNDVFAETPPQSFTMEQRRKKEHTPKISVSPPSNLRLSRPARREKPRSCHQWIDGAHLDVVSPWFSRKVATRDKLGFLGSDRGNGNDRQAET
jgi:hypothetical protein